MKRIILIVLAVLAVATVAHAEARSACDSPTDYASLNQGRLQRTIDLAHAYKNGWAARRDDAELKEFGCNVIELIDVTLQGRVLPRRAESREEKMAEFERARKKCAERADKILADDTWSLHWIIRSDCRRISSLRDDLIRCAHERNHLRIAAGCSHQWQDTGPGQRWCRECRSIAHFLDGKWQVVFTGGLYVGPDPLLYPEEYGLK